jgi:hypothetical protein
VKVIQRQTLIFNFVEKKFMNILKKIDLQCQAKIVNNYDPQKSLHILVDGASGMLNKQIL